MNTTPFNNGNVGNPFRNRNNANGRNRRGNRDRNAQQQQQQQQQQQWFKQGDQRENIFTPFVQPPKQQQQQQQRQQQQPQHVPFTPFRPAHVVAVAPAPFPPPTQFLPAAWQAPQPPEVQPQLQPQPAPTTAVEPPRTMPGMAPPPVRQEQQQQQPFSWATPPKSLTPLQPPKIVVANHRAELLKMILGKHFRFSRSGEWLFTVRFDDRGALKVWSSGKKGTAVEERWFVGWDDYTVCIGGRSCSSMLVVVEELREVVTRRGGRQQHQHQQGGGAAGGGGGGGSENATDATTDRVRVVLRQAPEEVEVIASRNSAANPEEQGSRPAVAAEGVEVSGPPAVHDGTTCALTGASPIVGERYVLVGSEPAQDICEAAFRSASLLTDGERALFACVRRPGDEPTPEGLTSVHEGVRCDVTGECPIVGVRYHLMGSDFDCSERGFGLLGPGQREGGRWIKLTRARDMRAAERRSGKVADAAVTSASVSAAAPFGK